MLILHHHGSSACAAKVRFMLEEKNLDWESRYVDILAGEQFAADFLALNPKAVVPVLQHNGQTITESTIICEYLEEAFPGHRLYPESPLARARVREWTKAVDEELHPACSAITYVMSHRFTILRSGVENFEDFLSSGGSEGRAARARKWQWIEQGLDAPGAVDNIRLYDDYLHKMEQALSESPWLAGAAFTMADIAMAPYINRLSALALESLWRHGRLPNLEAWVGRITARPAFQRSLVEWVPHSLRDEMYSNALKSRDRVSELLGI